MSVESEERNRILQWQDVVVACIVVFVLVALDVACWRMGWDVVETAVWFASFLAMLGLPALIARYRKMELARCAVETPFSWRGLAWGVGTMVVLFIPIVAGHYVWMTYGVGASASFSWSNYDAIWAQIPNELLWQFFCVALPEEYFYRGFVQTSFFRIFERSSKRSVQKYAAPLSIALASLLFAGVHVTNGGFVRMATFFPGCLFGMLRYKTDGIAGSVFAHAACNLMTFALNVHYA